MFTSTEIQEIVDHVIDSHMATSGVTVFDVQCVCRKLNIPYSDMTKADLKEVMQALPKIEKGASYV